MTHILWQVLHHPVSKLHQSTSRNIDWDSQFLGLFLPEYYRWRHKVLSYRKLPDSHVSRNKGGKIQSWAPIHKNYVKISCDPRRLSVRQLTFVLDVAVCIVRCHLQRSQRADEHRLVDRARRNGHSLAPHPFLTGSPRCQPYSSHRTTQNYFQYLWFWTGNPCWKLLLSVSVQHLCKW